MPMFEVDWFKERKKKERTEGGRKEGKKEGRKKGSKEGRKETECQ